MKGLELAEAYYNAYGKPLIEEKFSVYAERIAGGLVGEGSECFGFDDDLSRDHDWGPSFCLWLTKKDYMAVGAALQSEIDKLPGSFAGFAAREENVFGQKRVGVFSIGRSFCNYIGLDRLPVSWEEWLRIPESSLAVCTNGKVFYDPLGEYSRFRKVLEEFYPEDVCLKKIAARCMTIAQYGQYNFPRCLKRREFIAANYALANFSSDIISLVFLLNKRYKPFFKWMHRAVRNLPILGEYVFLSLHDLATTQDEEKKVNIIEEICATVIEELNQGELSDSKSDFLVHHGPVIKGKIKDPDLRAVDVWIG